MNKKRLQELKLDGFISQKNVGYFSLRIIAPAGKMSVEKMKYVNEIANKYGRGYISFTTRLSIEIPWIKEEDIENVKSDLKKCGLYSGGTGKIVRPIVACKGTVCPHGLIDTQGIAERLHKKYFATKLPSKLKIGIVGCPNNCAKASINDIGFMGQKIPKFQEENCKSCGLCVSVCKAGAITKEDGKIVRDAEKCVGCGKCINACHFGGMTTEKEGMQIFVGGKFGRKYRIGNRVNKIFSPEEAETIVEKITNYYVENANKGERIADMIDRIGFEELNKKLV
ncbi:4Fe-4S dicluster domain-containing protein [Clostridium sp.]|uniref:4Fe-4S dicluster domain-containing protein n=1 Tax=Clostridium sp. TaxID=1506 RepID=UPI003A5C3470